MGNDSLAKRLLRSACFAFALSYITITILDHLQPPAYEALYPVFETEEFIGPIVGILIFLISLLTPLPQSSTSLILTLRNILIAVLLAFINTIYAIQIDSVRATVGSEGFIGLAYGIILFIVLWIGLTLYPWKK